MKDNKSKTIRNLVIFILAILTMFFVVFLVKQFNKNENNTANNNASSESVESLGVSVKENLIQLIDVRSPEEYAVGHASGAINVPLDQIANGNFTEISKSTPVYLYCKSGNRASEAKIILENAGYEQVINLGGLVDWQTDGGKVCATSRKDC